MRFPSSDCPPFPKPLPLFGYRTLQKRPSHGCASRHPPASDRRAFRTPSRRPQDASTPPPSLIKIVRQSIRGFKPPPNAKPPQDVSKTPKHASKQPPRRLQDGPRRHQSALKTACVMEKITFSSPSQPTATSAVYAQAVLLCNLLTISNDSEITHTRGSAALA